MQMLDSKASASIEDNSLADKENINDEMRTVESESIPKSSESKFANDIPF